MTYLNIYQYAIKHNFRNVKHVLLVCSCKGGVGKTFIACGLAKALTTRSKVSVGLLDLDLYGFATHKLLGLKDLPKYEKIEDVTPLKINSIYYFTPALLVQDRAFPIHGKYREKTVLDVLAGIEWPSIDVLIVDSPPGIGEEIMLLCQYLQDKVKVLLVATCDVLAISIMKRLETVLDDLKVQKLGYVLNMCTECPPDIERTLGGHVLTVIPQLDEVRVLIQAGASPYVSERVMSYFNDLAGKITSLLHL